MLRTALVLIVLVSPAAAQPNVNSLARDKIVAAEKVYRSKLASLQAARSDVDAVCAWSVRWLDAELANGKAIKQALAEHLARMTALEAELTKNVKQAISPQSELDAAIYFKTEAELWVMKNKR